MHIFFIILIRKREGGGESERHLKWGIVSICTKSLLLLLLSFFVIHLRVGDLLTFNIPSIIMCTWWMTLSYFPFPFFSFLWKIKYSWKKLIKFMHKTFLLNCVFQFLFLISLPTKTSLLLKFSLFSHIEHSRCARKGHKFCG